MRDQKRLAGLLSRALIAVACGWATLLALAFGLERPLFSLTAPWFGPSWSATVHLALDCLTMAAAGWVCGRLNRAHAIASASLFALSLCFWDFGGAIALNVPLLVRLLTNAISDSRFLDSLATSVETHALLFGCLFAGAALSRPREKPFSVFETRPDAHL